MPWPSRAVWAVRLNGGLTPPRRAWELLERLGPDSLAKASPEDWASVLEGAVIDDVRRWHRASWAFDPAAEERRVESLGARLIARGEAA